jgi:very-short-patch-repair endonuclease
MRSEEQLLSELRQEAINTFCADYDEKMAMLLALCESPIERVLLSAIDLYNASDDAVTLFCKNKPFPAERLLRGHSMSGPPSEYIGGIYPQVSIGPYRADIYFEVFDSETLKCWFRLDIECDGHEFHERTKDQAARDKRRDRWFQAKGISVARFTGSEIWASPSDCADQIWDTFSQALKRQYFL